MNNQEVTIFENIVQTTTNGFIAIKPCCDLFAIDYKNQVDRIREDFILSELVGSHPLVAADNSVRDMVSLPKSGFIRWVFTIQVNRMEEQNRLKFQNFVKWLHYELMGETPRAKAVQEKQKRLYNVKANISVLELEVIEIKEVLKSKKEDLAKLNQDFWELFNSDENQLKLAI